MSIISNLVKFIAQLDIMAAPWTDYFQMEEVLNICIRIQNQSHFLCQLLKCYLFSVLISAFGLLFSKKIQLSISLSIFSYL